jgi:hypothetical protein
MARSVLVTILLALGATSAYACSAPMKWTPETIVSDADGICRAIAVDYLEPQPTPLLRGIRADIAFQVLGNIKGKAATELIIHGVLTDADDMNDRPVP